MSSGGILKLIYSDPGRMYPIRWVNYEISDDYHYLSMTDAYARYTNQPVMQIPVPANRDAEREPDNGS